VSSIAVIDFVLGDGGAYISSYWKAVVAGYECIATGGDHLGGTVHQC
jgi:hypothetical protein